MLITPPAPLPLARVQWRLRQPNQVNRSAWTGKRQVSTMTPRGAIWLASGEFVPVIGQASARKWRGFFASLNGVANWFPLVASQGAQHGGANPTVSAGASGANTLTLSASPPALLAGDMMTVPLADGTKQLVVLTGNISGTTATFMPPLRAAASAGGTVETILPYAHVALAEEVFSWDIAPGQQFGFAFEAVEAF